MKSNSRSVCFAVLPVMGSGGNGASRGSSSTSSSAEELRPEVPRSAGAAAGQMRRAVQTALVSGRRRMVVDLLLADVDPRQRTYDEKGAREVYRALAKCGTVTGRGAHVVVNGATTATRARAWLSDTDGVSIGVLGTADNLRQVDEKDMVITMINPDGGVKAMMDFRKLLRSTTETDPNKALVVCNHPRDHELYRMNGYNGTTPIEMSGFDDTFVLIPFGIEFNAVTWRFVLMKQYPWNWAFYVYVNGTSQENNTNEQNKFNVIRNPTQKQKQKQNETDQVDNTGDYVLFKEFTWRPDESDVRMAVSEAIAEFTVV